MPLRDHFRSPVNDTHSWDEVHGGWPMEIVRDLTTILPAGFRAAPKVHLGSPFEVDVSTYDLDSRDPDALPAPGGRVATLTTQTPTLTVEADVFDADEYEVRIYDAKRGRHLVAAIELVSPANKDRLEHRNVFVAKCAALIQKGVAVSIVDLVTVQQFNLYTELLTFIGHSDPTMGEEPPHLYAASCRWVLREPRGLLESWPVALAVGQPLPELPLWLADALVVPLDLEESYERTCRDLWIA